MATQSKVQFLNEIHALLKKRYKPKPERAGGKLTVLEAMVYGVCHEGTTREQANQALSRFKDDFFDWNEVRVSSIDEIQGVLAGLPDREGRAHRIRRFLRQLFEKTYGFTLEALLKKPLKEAVKQLNDYETFASSDYVAATVIQQALGGHAIPVDGPARRALERLGVADSETDVVAIRSLLERAVPKNRGAEMLDLLEELAHDTCVEGEPDCPRCELRKICPTARARKEAAAAGPKVSAAAVKPGKDGVKEKAAKPAALAPAPAAPAGTAKGGKTVARPAKAAAPPVPAPAPKEPAKPSKTSKGKPGGAK